MEVNFIYNTDECFVSHFADILQSLGDLVIRAALSRGLLKVKH